MSKYKIYNICIENQNLYYFIYFQLKSSLKIFNFFIISGFKNIKIDWENFYFFLFLSIVML